MLVVVGLVAIATKTQLGGVVATLIGTLWEGLRWCLKARCALITLIVSYDSTTCTTEMIFVAGFAFKLKVIALWTTRLTIRSSLYYSIARFAVFTWAFYFAQLAPFPILLTLASETHWTIASRKTNILVCLWDERLTTASAALNFIHWMLMLEEANAAVLERTGVVTIEARSPLSKFG